MLCSHPRATSGASQALATRIGESLALTLPSLGSVTVSSVLLRGRHVFCCRSNQRCSSFIAVCRCQGHIKLPFQSSPNRIKSIRLQDGVHFIHCSGSGHRRFLRRLDCLGPSKSAEEKATPAGSKKHDGKGPIVPSFGAAVCAWLVSPGRASHVYVGAFIADSVKFKGSIVA
jgi:hypothetical protein